MRLFQLILFSLFITLPVVAQECDCKIFPFKPDPPCPEKCTPKLLFNANKEELQLVVGLDEGTAEAVSKAKKKEPMNSFEPFREALTAEQFKTLEEKVRDLSETQVEYLSKSVAERKAMRQELCAVLNRKVCSDH
jgi:hypothetical protein